MLLAVDHNIIITLLFARYSSSTCETLYTIHSRRLPFVNRTPGQKACQKPLTKFGDFPVAIDNTTETDAALRSIRMLTTHKEKFYAKKFFLSNSGVKF